MKPAPAPPAPLSGIEIAVPFALLAALYWLAQIVIEAVSRGR